jgi:hypothetical protein
MHTRRVNPRLSCWALLVALEIVRFPAQASLPTRGPPPCDQQLKALTTSALVQRLPNLEHDAWNANCVVEEFGKRGRRAAAAVPGLIKLMNDPHSSDQTIGNAIAALARIGDAAATAVPGITRFASSSDEQTSWMAIWGLENIGKSATPAIPALVKVALTEGAPSGLAVQNYAATTVGKLGRFDPATAGPYLVKLANRPSLIGGVSEGIQWMGASAKPWALELTPILNQALLDVLKQEAEATPTGNPAEKASSAYIVAHNLEDEITRALATLSNNVNQ